MTKKNEPIRPSKDDWKAGFEGVREDQLKAGMAATPKQRIEMLEALMTFALKAGALPRRDPY